MKDSKTKIISKIFNYLSFYRTKIIEILGFRGDNLLYIKLNVEEWYTYTISRSSLH